MGKYAHSSFNSLMQSLLPRDTLLRTFMSIMSTNHFLNSCIMANQKEVFKISTHLIVPHYQLIYED